MQRVRPIKICDVALSIANYKYFKNNNRSMLGPAYCQAMSLLYNNACCMYCHIKGNCNNLYNWNFMLR